MSLRGRLRNDKFNANRGKHKYDIHTLYHSKVINNNRVTSWGILYIFSWRNFFPHQSPPPPRNHSSHFRRKKNAIRISPHVYKNTTTFPDFPKVWKRLRNSPKDSHAFSKTDHDCKSSEARKQNNYRSIWNSCEWSANRLWTKTKAGSLRLSR